MCALHPDRDSIRSETNRNGYSGKQLTWIKDMPYELVEKGEKMRMSSLDASFPLWPARLDGLIGLVNP